MLLNNSSEEIATVPTLLITTPAAKLASPTESPRSIPLANAKEIVLITVSPAPHTSYTCTSLAG